MRKFRKRNWIILGVLVLLIFVPLSYSLIRGRAPVSITTDKARITDMKVTVSASAITSSSSEIALNFDSPGKIEQVYIKEGDLVAPGQILAKQHASQLNSQLKQAKAGLRSARANLSKLREGAIAEDLAVSQVTVDSAAISLEAAQRKFAEVQNQAEQDAAAVQVSVDNTKATRDFTLRDREEAVDEYWELVRKYEHPVLHIPNYTPSEEAEIDAAKAAADTAMNTYLAAEAAYKNALETKKNVDLKNHTALQAALDAVNSANSQYHSALTQQNLKKAPARRQDTQVAKAQVDQAEASLEIAQNNLENATLESPVRGKIISISADEGEFVAGGSSGLATTAFIIVADLEKSQAIADVDETDIEQVEVGQEAEVVLDAYPSQPITGRVAEISYQAKQTEAGGTALPAKISLDLGGKDVKVRKGMNADVNIVVSVKKNILSVPLEAVVEKEGKDVVFVIQNGRAKMREVTVGLSTDEFFEIQRGLKENENIAIKNAEKLKDGDKVIVR